MSDHVDGYANALLAVAEAEGDVETTRGQLAAVARAVEGNDELQASLSNNLLPASVRSQIVDDVLAGKTSNTTRALVSMIVSSGRGRDLSKIVDAFSRVSAAGSGRRVAVVRSAVALSDAQRARLSKALSAQLGYDVELDMVIDPDVVGGLVTTVGDTVIDGSVRTRLARMREAL